eukprot:GHUV01028454.1.p1 GENE.GHUV01028454.1~~GHUV01028454.1.p1  ORF type:complete len:243 (+),score=56.64 GHUV01028454.1:127-855(+)
MLQIVMLAKVLQLAAGWHCTVLQVLRHVHMDGTLLALPSHPLATLRVTQVAASLHLFRTCSAPYTTCLTLQVDLDCLSEAFRTEQKEYYLNTSAWGNVHPTQLLGPGVAFKKYDLLNVTLEQLKADLAADVDLPMVDGGPIDAFCGWFDVDFQGSPEHPADEAVRLTTGPDPTGSTHWGQQVFMMNPSIDCAPGDTLSCNVKITRQQVNHRLLEMAMSVKVEGKSIYAQESSGPRQLNWHID